MVYEVANQRTTKYHGTYTKFLKQKQANYERDLRQYEKQQQEIKEMEDFVARNIARASTTKRAQSRRKQLDKIIRLEKPAGNEANAKFSFDIARTSGNDVLDITDFSFRHQGTAEDLFSHASLTVHRGERIALIGENGIGKTTLLKEIMKQIHPQIVLGANVQIGYYAQEQEQLHPKNTILEEVWNDFPDKNEQDIRTILGNFLFTGEDVLKVIHSLSGGERARVTLVKLMLKKANLLILDEPTNHLDLTSKEVLETALLHYQGTILFVSHDRYFINKIADQIAELKSDGIIVYLGDYDYYLEKKAEEAAIQDLENQKHIPDKKIPAQQLSFEEQKRQQSAERKKMRQIEKLEKEIEEKENELEKVEQTMTEPHILEDHEELLSLSQKADKLREEIENTMEEWTNLQE